MVKRRAGRRRHRLFDSAQAADCFRFLQRATPSPVTAIPNRMKLEGSGVLEPRGEPSTSSWYGVPKPTYTVQVAPELPLSAKIRFLLPTCRCLTKSSNSYRPRRASHYM